MPGTVPALPSAAERGEHSPADRRDGSGERRREGEARRSSRGDDHSRRRHHRGRSERSSSRRSHDPEALATHQRGQPGSGTEDSREPATLPRSAIGSTLLENRSRSRRHRNGTSVRRRVRTGWGAIAARSLAVGTGFAALALAAWLASAYPLSSLVAVTAVVVLAVAGAASPAWAPIVVLPLLPLIGLMPWTGWLVVEEFDILLLALAGGAYLRLALGPPAGQPLARQSLTRAAWLGLPFVASAAISAVGGLLDSGALAAAATSMPGPDTVVDAVAAAASGAASAPPVAGTVGAAIGTPLGWHWWHGYHEALNSLRLAKPALAVLLWLPLWRAASRADAVGTARRFELAMVGMGAVTALCVISERLAHTGLLNFSTDYRATGPFWEMHVGGAALDCVLAATLPFMATVWWRARTRAGWLVAAAVLGLGLYAAIVTFSRIVYLAVPLSLAVAWLVHWYGHRAARGGAAKVAAGSAGRERALPAAIFGALVFTALAAWFFPGAGWRGLIMLCGALVLLLPLGHLIRGWVWERWAMAAAVALVATLLLAGVALVLPKGAYVAYALAFAGCAVAIAFGERGVWWAQVAAPGLFVALLTALAGVSWHWGELRGIERALVVVVVLAGVAAAATRETLWPRARRWQGALVIACVGIAALVGVFGGGAYMAGRLTETTRDTQSRADHWQRAIELLRHPEDWFFGKGLGRYPEQQALMADKPERAGDLRLVHGSEGRLAVALAAGTEPVSGSGVFRMSQRIGLPEPGPLAVRLDVRAARGVELLAEVCEKHLIYPGRCMTASVVHQPAPEKAVQPVELVLKGGPLSAGAFWAPRWIVFSVAVANSNGRVEIERISLRDRSGQELIANGGFDGGLARWFFTSDRLHLPWHAKNLPLHVLFEQGVFGLASLALLAAAALWRVTAGAARRRTLAAPLAGAWVGMMTVGLVDSLLDMPRAGFVLLMVLALAVALPAGRASSSRAHGAAADGDPGEDAGEEGEEADGAEGDPPNTGGTLSAAAPSSRGPSTASPPEPPLPAPKMPG